MLYKRMDSSDGRKPDDFSTGAAGVTAWAAVSHHQSTCIQHTALPIAFPSRKGHRQVDCYWSKQYGYDLTTVSKASPDQ
jgi:hypothetical protein